MGQRIPVSLWLNYLCLDAPLVALVWQDFLARCYPSVLRMPGRWMLGLTVWAIYLADRLLDVRFPSLGEETAAHAFCRRHRFAASVLLGAALGIDGLIASIGLRPGVFANGLVVVAGVVTYMGAFPAAHIDTRMKKVAAAILFMTGVFVVAWTGTGDAMRTLGPPAIAFGSMCLANLILVHRWKRDVPAFVGVGSLILAAACIVFAGGSEWYAAVSMSAAALAGLAFLGNKFSFATRGVLADAALLTPLLFLWMRTG